MKFKKYQILRKGKEEFNRVLSCLFGGKQKVQVTKTPSLLSVPCCEQRLSSQYFAVIPTPNIAELVFFLMLFIKEYKKKLQYNR